MRIKLFIILILMLGGLFIMIAHHKFSNKDVPVAFEEPEGVYVEPIDITVPKSLKTNFKRGTDYCNTQNIAQNGVFENCVLYYIYERNKKDHETILKINTYCDKTTTNECDRRNCVERFME